MRAPASDLPIRFERRHASSPARVTILDRVSLDDPARRADRADRPERLRQDHAAARRDGAARAVPRPGHLGRRRRRAAGRGAPSCSSARSCCGAAPRATSATRCERPASRDANGTSAGRGAAVARRARRHWRRARRGGCPAASSSGWRSRARLPAIPPCCSSTSRPRASIPPPPRRSRTSIRAVAARGIKVVMATHDLGEARRLAGDIVLLHRGRVIETATAADVLRSPANRQRRSRFLAGELLL